MLLRFPRPLHDLVIVWRDTRLIVLVAQTAAVYAAILIPFKMGIPLIPGFTELRPANAFPIVASLLFGPAAAWGSGFGNLIGDCFGTLGPASVFGFLGNFCYGYVPSLLWGHLGPLSSRQDPEPRSWRQAVELGLVCLAASVACALVIGWGVDLLGLIPFGILAPAIFINNFLMAILLAPPLLLFLHPRVKRWGLLFHQIVRHETSDVRGTELSFPASPVSRLTSHVLLSLEDVSFTYDGSVRPALDRLSLAVNRGESVALMGRAGAGKSTLCYALNGLVPHLLAGRWAGSMTVNGHDTLSRPIWRQAGTVGLVFQEFEAQLVSTTVEMELAFPLQHLDSPLTPAAMRRRIARTLAQLGLSGLERRNPLSLSGGQRQRLVLASILVREPSVIVLDEPTTDLDPAGRWALASLLATLNASGATLIVAEHDPEEAVRADRICLLDRGALAWEGRPRELFGRSDQAAFAARHGIRPLPLAACFDRLGVPDLPLTVEEAWALCDEQGLAPAPENTMTRDEPPTPGAPLIEVQRVCYEYQPGAAALSDISLTIRDGEFVALIGENGSGKSTLATLLNGLRNPTRGRVLVQGLDSRQRGPGQLAAIVGYVFQNPDHQIFAETVGSEVSFGVRNLGASPEECEKRVASALDAVGLGAPEIRHLDPFSLTKGDRQRIAVASALAARPRILVFDEPTTGFDADETDRMMRMLQRLNREGHTIVVITHSLELVAAYAHRTILLKEGRITADGPTRQVFQALSNPERETAAGPEIPPLTRFAARWGQTLLTPEEVRASFRRNGGTPHPPLPPCGGGSGRGDRQ